MKLLQPTPTTYPAAAAALAHLPERLNIIVGSIITEQIRGKLILVRQITAEQVITRRVVRPSVNGKFSARPTVTGWLNVELCLNQRPFRRLYSDFGLTSPEDGF